MAVRKECSVSVRPFIPFMCVLLSCVAMSTQAEPTGKMVRTPSLLVCMTDSASGKPLIGASARIPKPRYFASLRTGKNVPDTPEEAWWYGITDSTGCTLLSGFRAGSYRLWLDDFCYRFEEREVRAVAGRHDTIRVAMVFVGRPSDEGRINPETLKIMIDPSKLKRASRKFRP